MDTIYRMDVKRLASVLEVVLVELRRKNFLLLGATGSIMSYMAKLLIEMNDEYGLDNHFFLQTRDIMKIMERFSDYKDRGDVDFLQFNFDSEFPMNIRFDYIIHGASPASAVSFKKAPVDVILSNVFGMRNVLEYQRIKKEDGLHSIFLSSQAIYGSVDLNEIRECDYGYIDPLAERSCYVEAKRLTEQMCAAYAKQYGVLTSVVRVPYAYGPAYDLEHDTRALPRFIKKIVSGKSFEMIEDDQKIQYTYTGDIVSGILYILLKGSTMPDGVYNIGGDDVIRLQDMVQTMINYAQNGSDLILKKGKFSLKGNKELDYTVNNTDKLRKLGWRPCFDCQAGLSRTIKAFL